MPHFDRMNNMKYCRIIFWWIVAFKGFKGHQAIHSQKSMKPFFVLRRKMWTTTATKIALSCICSDCCWNWVISYLFFLSHCCQWNEKKGWRKSGASRAGCHLSLILHEWMWNCFGGLWTPKGSFQKQREQEKWGRVKTTSISAHIKACRNTLRVIFRDLRKIGCSHAHRLFLY